MARKLSKPMLNLLKEIAEAGKDGMVVPGAKGSTARVLRVGEKLIEYVGEERDWSTTKPTPQRATPAGLSLLADLGIAVKPCVTCGNPFKSGEHRREADTGGHEHAACADGRLPPLPKEIDDTIDDVLDATGDAVLGQSGPSQSAALERLSVAIRRALDKAAKDAVREHVKALSTWAVEKAGAAQREAEAHEAQVTGQHGHLVSDTSHHERALTCEGQSVAFKAVVTKLGEG